MSYVGLRAASFPVLETVPRLGERSRHLLPTHSLVSPSQLVPPELRGARCLRGYLKRQQVQACSWVDLERGEVRQWEGLELEERGGWGREEEGTVPQRKRRVGAQLTHQPASTGWECLEGNRCRVLLVKARDSVGRAGQVCEVGSCPQEHGLPGLCVGSRGRARVTVPVPWCEEVKLSLEQLGKRRAKKATMRFPGPENGPGWARELRRGKEGRVVSVWILSC